MMAEPCSSCKWLHPRNRRNIRCAESSSRANWVQQGNCNCSAADCIVQSFRSASSSCRTCIGTNFPGCNCFAPRGIRQSSPENACNCGWLRQRNLLEYLCTRESPRHTDACKCCDVYAKFRQCSPNSPPCKCPCIDNGHKTHFFCNATDQNLLLSRVEALRYKIRKSVQWLLINLTIFVAVFFDESFPSKVAKVVITTTNFLNVCYYIQNLVKLYIALAQIKLERPAYRTNNCLWEKNLPQNLTRYFEDSSEAFFVRYYSYFCTLVSALKNIRASSLGRKETRRDMEQELRAQGETFLMAREAEFRARSRIEEARYRLPQMKWIKQPVWTAKQLKKYLEKYAEACEDEKVRLSKEQLPFRPGACSTPLPGISGSLKMSEDHTSYYEVAVSPILKRSQYQHACEMDVHPSPAVPSGSFFDFMKLHHGINYCSSSRWVANLKLWLSEKIKELVVQFDRANEALARHEAANTRIGISSIADLQTVIGKNEELFTLKPLLTFLTLTHNQSYLVSRYKILASQPCLSSYKWRSGGDKKGNWAPESGPCDSDIVLHFFCSYMDMILPDVPFHPTKKRPFTDHFVVNPDHPLDSAGEIAIVRQWAVPPHFNVSVKGRVYEIPGGSNNLFLALTYLIYCIKIYQQGKIGRISLEQPELNLLSIISST